MYLGSLLVFISVLAFAHTEEAIEKNPKIDWEGEAINCYQCNSYKDPNCADPFDIENGKQFLKACPSDGKNYFCRKIDQKVRDDEQVIRSCGHEIYLNMAGEEKDSYTTIAQEYDTLVTDCKEKGCNGSITIKISIIFNLMAFALAFLVK